jgi:hypothetical protein
MKPRIMYIERKAGQLIGEARMGRVTFSRSGKTICYRGKAPADLCVSLPSPCAQRRSSPARPSRVRWSDWLCDSSFLNIWLTVHQRLECGPSLDGPHSIS